MELSFPLFAGILASMLHVISGPDHLAAVTPFAIESKNKAWKVGLAWGIGHVTGMLAIGLLFLLFKDIIPVENISEHSEQLVGFILILLGCWILFKIFNTKKKHEHVHVHSHENIAIHKHQHLHNYSENHNHVHSNLKQGIVASISVGFIHGLAGVAHFLLFLPVIGFSSTFDSVKYIIGFGIGTLIAMISYAVVIGKVSELSKHSNSEVFFKGIRLAGGLFALAVGIFWISVN